MVPYTTPPKGLFLKWLDIEYAAGKKFKQVLDEVNAACGTSFQHNWRTKLAKTDYSVAHINVEVRRYMMMRVLPAELSARGVNLPAKAIEEIVLSIS